MSKTVEAKSIDHRLVPDQAKQARARIAGLRQRRNRSDFGKAEAKAQHRVDDLAILVETGREPDRIWKIEAESADGEARVVRPDGGQRQFRQRLDAQPVGGLGIEPEQDRPHEDGQNISPA